MSIFESFSQAWASIRSNKMRSLLTMLGIIIGIAAVIAIVTLGSAMQTFVNSNMQSMGAGTIVINVRERTEDEPELFFSFNTSSSTLEPTNSDMLTTQDLANLKQNFPGRIKSIGTIAFGPSGQLQDGRRRANVSLYGANEDFMDAQGLTIMAGRWITPSDISASKHVAVISQNAADNIFRGTEEALGKEVKLYIGSDIQSYVVIGVYKYKSNMADMMMSAIDIPTELYAPISLVKAQYNQPTNYSTAYVSGELNESVTKLTDDINDHLEALYRRNLKFEAVASNFESQLETFTQILDMITTVIGVIAGISLLVGGVGVMNIMLVSVTERTREIGTRKAIGATSGNILLQFIIEALFLCLIGGILGILLGGLMGWVGSGIIGFNSLPPLYAVVASVIFSMLMGVFFGAYPAWKASKLLPIEALRYE